MKRHTQQGFGIVSLIGTLIAFGLLSYFIMQMGIETQKATIYAKSKNFYEQLDVIKEALLAYQVDKITEGEFDPDIYVPNWAALTPNYLAQCSSADNLAGKCRQAEQTLWGDTMTLMRVTQSTYPFWSMNEITIPLPPVTDAFKFEHDVHLATLLKLPFAKYDESANTITWQVRKVGEELQHDGLVRRSGDNSTLTGDWDVGGNFAITNAKAVTVRNSDGTQRRLGAGIVSTIIAKHNQRINKHSCPSGLTPGITTAIKGLYNETNPRLPFNNIGALRTYSVENSRYWTIKLDYWVEVQGAITPLHDGDINVQLICH